MLVRLFKVIHAKYSDSAMTAVAGYNKKNVIWKEIIQKNIFYHPDVSNNAEYFNNNSQIKEGEPSVKQQAEEG
jgi:hypothetical protein